MEAREVVLPAAGMFGLFGAWQVAVFQVDASAVAFGGKSDLYRAGPRRQVVRTGVTPADEQPARRVDMQVAAPDRRPLDVEAEPAAWLGLEQGVFAHPGDHRLRPGEVLKHPFRRGLDVD